MMRTICTNRGGGPRKTSGVIGRIHLAAIVAGALCMTVQAAGAEPRDFADAGLPSAAFEDIADNVASSLKVFRYSGNANILVFDYPSLRAQARALNRIATLVESRDAPRDRVLSDGELVSHIEAAGANQDTFYIGHDYRAADIARFFNLAGDATLNAAERHLKAMLVELEFIRLSDGAYQVVEPEKVLVTVVQKQADDPTTRASEHVDADLRDAILRHELSHGEFFTNPAYRDYCVTFWRSRMSAAERTRFRAFLTRLNYDPANEQLMINEMQAYLMHTPDAEIFNPAILGTTAAELDGLRRRFLAGDPPSRLFEDGAALVAKRPAN